MTIQILSLIIALLAVIVSPYITYRIAKRNLEFQFRTMTQEKWINDLEKDSHLFLTFSLEWIEKYRGLIDGSAQNDNPVNEINRIFDGINSSIVKLQLHLDSQKPDQKKILDNVIQMKDIINKKSFDDASISKLKECHESIITNLKLIFHNERTKISLVFK